MIYPKADFTTASNDLESRSGTDSKKNKTNKGKSKKKKNPTEVKNIDVTAKRKSLNSVKDDNGEIFTSAPDLLEPLEKFVFQPYKKRKGGTTGRKRLAFKLEDLPKNVTSYPLRFFKDDKTREEPFHYGMYTEEEDKRIISAVYEYIQSKGWPRETGVKKFIAGKRDKDVKNCWSEITTCLYDRPMIGIMSRTKRLMDDNNWKGLWTLAEEKKLTELVAEHGLKWNKLSEEMGRNAEALRYKYRDLGDGHEIVRGRWSYQEMEQLSLLVHDHMRSKRRHLFSHNVGGRQVRDDINWTSISVKLRRRVVACLRQWYYRLCPFLVLNGQWGNYDDMRMLYALTESQAEDEVDVDWDSLLPDREGPVCYKRWRQMKRHLFDGFYSFEAWLSMAVERFAPELLNPEEDYDSWRREGANVKALLGGDGDNEVAALLRSGEIDLEKLEEEEKGEGVVVK